MAAVEVTISGVLYDKYCRTMRPVVLIGEASYTGLGIGGGPIIPPGQPGDGGPPHIWGPPDMPPGFWGGGMGPGVRPQPHPEHPIIIPIPPDSPNVPPPGSPPMMVGGTQPVQPITPPSAVIIEYPGVGKVIVPLPTATAPDGKK